MVSGLGFKNNVAVVILAIAASACSNGFRAANLEDPIADLAAQADLEAQLRNGSASLKMTSAAQRVAANDCSDAVQVALVKSNGAADTFRGTIGLPLSSADNSVTFFSDAACANEISIFTLSGSTATGIFYFQGSTSGSKRVVANLLNIVTVSQTETILAANPTPSPTPSATPTPTPTVTPKPSPNPTQTPTPKPSPVPTSSPGALYPYPNAGTTGVPPGTVLTPSGDITVTTNGAVIDSKLVTGCIFVKANNVTIKNTKVLGGGCYEPINTSNTGLVVQDSEIDGQKSAMCGEAIGYGGYTLLRVNAHGCSDGPRLAENANIVIKDSYIHDLSNLPGDHGDGMQAYGLNLAAGDSVQILHNTIEGGTNSAIFTADGATGDLIVDGNLLMGPNYPLKLYDNHAWVRNNLIYDDSGHEYDTFYGPVATWGGDASDPGLTIEEWTNNHTTSTRDGSVIGPALAHP